MNRDVFLLVVCIPYQYSIPVMKQKRALKSYKIIYNSKRAVGERFGSSAIYFVPTMYTHQTNNMQNNTVSIYSQANVMLERDFLSHGCV